MKHFKVKLKEYYPSIQEGDLEAFVLENSPQIDPNGKHKAVLILPGGGYSYCSDREAEPIALSLIAKGISAFILRYSVAPHQYPTQVLEAMAAMSYIRQHAEAYAIDPEAISVLGFSAGGHVAASLAAKWNLNHLTSPLGIEPEECKPNKLLLSYPVITMKEYTHAGSKRNLLGEDASEAFVEENSIETQVTSMFPPTFIWSTATDQSVPIENTLFLVQALRKNGIPFEVHIYPQGVHGLSLANHLTAKPNQPQYIEPGVESWFDHLLHFIDL